MRQAHEGQHPLSLPLSYTIMAVWACHCHSPLHLSGNMTIPIREAETARYATQVGTLSAYSQYKSAQKSANGQHTVSTRSANIRHKSRHTVSIRHTMWQQAYPHRGADANRGLHPPTCHRLGDGASEYSTKNLKTL